ncbi:MAG: AAA family ATPase [Acidimicrobiales bacterium]
MSRLDLVVGPNGAGMTTFVEQVLAPQRPGALLVNADIIAAERWPDDAETHAYEAAKIAEATRSALIKAGKEIIAETVFSHPSKLELVDEALAAGYFVALHVLMLPEDLAVARVAYRVERGGHAVPVEKIRGRYTRLWTYVAHAAEKASSAAFWDNASLDGPLLVAEIESGVLLSKPRWPTWAPASLTERWAL